MPDDPQILFEDEHLLVLNKPPCWHSAHHSEGRSIAGWLTHNRPSLEGLGPPDFGLVQRLDFETSGVLLAAKDEATRRVLREALRAHKIRKEYLFVAQLTTSLPAECDAPLGGRYRGSKKVTPHHARTQPAMTRFELVRTINSHCELVRATTITGRRHQIRAHAGILGMPLVGDALYGSNLLLADCGIAHPAAFILHAENISFRHPVSGEEVRYQSKLSLE